jgi:hypothetical protein
MKLVILTAMHARHDLNRIFCMAMKRLRDSYGIETLSVISTGDQENIKICEEYGIFYITHKNKPVSDKFNAGLDALRYLDWTHVMILGSDDLPSNKFIELHLQHKNKDFIAINDMWFWGLNPKRAGWDKFYYWAAGSSRLGAGRTISRRVVESCDYKIWPSGRNSGLDGASWGIISGTIPKMKKKIYNQKELGGFLVDIKYELHISSLSPISRRCDEADYKVIWDHLPGVECEALLRLRAKVKTENFL